MEILSTRFAKGISKSKANVAPIAVSGRYVDLLFFYLTNDSLYFGYFFSECRFIFLNYNGWF